MKVGEKLVIGRMGQQPLSLTDSTVDPQHATIERKSTETYVLTDNHSSRGTFVFGIRILRKTITADTPFFLGSYKTSVNKLLTDASNVDLASVWNTYDHEKRRWDRYSMLVNSIRTLTPLLTMLVTQMVGQNWMVSAFVALAVMGISFFAGEKVLEKKTIAMAALNARMQTEYACPHCHRFLGLIPYSILKSRTYCPHCSVPLK